MEKKSAATISAAEQQLDGWPLPAVLVERTLSMRRCVAAFRNAVSCSGDNVDPAMPSPLVGNGNAREADGLFVKTVLQTAESEANKQRVEESTKMEEESRYVMPNRLPLSLHLNRRFQDRYRR